VLSGEEIPEEHLCDDVTAMEDPADGVTAATLVDAATATVAGEDT